jgi:hypothetical protein
MTNKDVKSSRIIKVSKDRVESAKNRVNYITLKYGDFDLTSQIKTDLNKRNINKVVSNLEKKILINSKSYGRIDRAPNENLRSYLKEINVKSSNKKNRSIIKSNAKKKKNFIVDSSRNLKTTENENKNNIYDNINLDENYKKYNIKMVPEKKEEIDDNNINKEEKIINLKKSIEANKSRNIGNSEDEKFKENLKSEEEKKYIISSSSNKIVKNNNFFNKQFSDKPENCISEEEVDGKNQILVSKLEIDSGNTKLIKDEKENSHKILPTENGELIKGLENKNNIITDSESSKSNKLIDENSNNQSEIDIDKKKENNNKEIIKINNKLNGKNSINSNNNNIKCSETKIKEKEEGKQNIVKFKDEFRGKNKPFEDLRNVRTYQNVKRNLYKKCSICENTYPLSKLFVPLCETHFLCRHCSKYYLEDIIENGVKDLNCPFIKCKKPFDENDLKDMISNHHFNILKNNDKNLIEESNNFYYNNKKENDDKGIVDHYNKKNIIDINTNKKLYNYKNTKGVVCSKCNMESLFSKTNTHFLKCLYCECKKCKYCLKDYDDEHLDINSPSHCKVYYRYDRKDLNNSGFCLRLFLQLFFVVACYFLCFASTFIKIRNVFYFVFRAKTTGNIMLYLFAYFFTVFFFIIIIPFYIVFYPYFPCIMSSTDY